MKVDNFVFSHDETWLFEVCVVQCTFFFFLEGRGGHLQNPTYLLLIGCFHLEMFSINISLILELSPDKTF